MQHLIDEGKVRYGGLSNHSTKLIARALKVGTVVSSQNQYNPLQRRAESELFPFCLEREIAVLGWGSLSEGALADSFDINELDLETFEDDKCTPSGKIMTRSRRSGRLSNMSPTIMVGQWFTPSLLGN